jgi:protein gp37
MADHSDIEWTDATWHPITGCTLVSEGCRHCYAAQLAATRLQHHPSRVGLARINAAGEAKFTGEVRFNADWLDQPLRWKRPRKIFVCAHGDLFHESVPDDWIHQVFAVMALCPQHVFQVLTKRPERARDYLRFLSNRDDLVAAHAVKLRQPPIAEAEHIRIQVMRAVRLPLPNVWLGTSVEDQAAADLRIPMLLQAPAAVRFISAEPLLERVDLFRWLAPSGQWNRDNPPDTGLHWVIVGGESGRNARPMHPDWVRTLRGQCLAADIAFFFKQWGAYLPRCPQYADEFDADEAHMICSGLPFPEEGVLYRDGYFYDGVVHQPHVGVGAYWVARVGKAKAGRLLDGRDHNGMPGGATVGTPARSRAPSARAAL